MLSLVGLSAKADVYYCNFTEPFITVQLDTDTGKLVWDQADQSILPSEVKLKASRENANAVEADLQFTTAAKNFVITLALDLNTQGSDGMSEFIYPIQAKLLKYWEVNGQYRDHYGACSTKSRPVLCKNPAGCG